MCENLITRLLQITLLEVSLFRIVFTLPSTIRVGAIFPVDRDSTDSVLAFKYAIDSINLDKDILPDTTILYDVQYVGQMDSFHASKKVCTQINSGIQAVFGPSDAVLGSHIHSVCDALDIPHLEARIDLEATEKEFSINLYPTQNYINDAIIDVTRYLNWTKVGILHEKDYGVIQLRELGRKLSIENHVRQVDPSTYLKVLKDFKNKEVHNIIIDTDAEHVSELLRGILQLQMNEYKYHYLFTSFDIETFDLEDFKYNFVNITSFRLVDVEDVGVKEILKDMEAYSIEQRNSKKSENTFELHRGLNTNANYRKQRTIKTEPALIFDSVYVFAIGLQTLEQSHTLTLSNVSCAEENPWDGGLSLINYINAVEWKGLTGFIQFKEGRRIQFKLDLVKLKPHAIVKVGEWTPQTRLNITDPTLFFEQSSINVTLVVITILETPYVMMHYGKNFTGNERFYGFCVDILDLIARDVGFDYILDLVPDKKYGAKNPATGEWNGMVAQLMKYKADLAVGSMTITYARESVIDFTKPFMNLGISILFKVPDTPPSRLFSFMNPLAFEIWIYVVAAYFLVSFTIYIVGNFSPLEWRVSHTCDWKNPYTLSNQFTLGNSFWFTIGTLMQQGSDVSPKAISTRIVGSIWWFFTLIIIASYTANLAAFLTVERMSTPIENAEDLASQTEISYGTLESGSTMTFFRDSMIETYRKMWRSMASKKNPSAFTRTYEEGIRRVNEGNYAFLMESTMLNYIVNRDCNLTQIGGLLDSKSYGIATPKASPWRDKISLAILELQEKGDIQMLYDKWWKNNQGRMCVRKSNSKQKTKANALDMDNIGGVFVVLVVGITIAIFVAIYEFWYFHRQKLKKEEQLTPLMKCAKEITDGENLEMIQLREDAFQFATLGCAQHTPRPRSLWVEMFEEFRYALHCMDPRRRPVLRSRIGSLQELKDLDAQIEASKSSSLQPQKALLVTTTVNADIITSRSVDIIQNLEDYNGMLA